MSDRTLTKQPREAIFYSMRFANLLDDAEVITNIQILESVVVSSANQSPQALTISDSSIFDHYIRFKISGGTTGTLYKVSAVIDTDQLNTFEGDGLLEVKNT